VNTNAHTISHHNFSCQSPLAFPSLQWHLTMFLFLESMVRTKMLAMFLSAHVRSLDIAPRNTATSELPYLWSRERKFWLYPCTYELALDTCRLTTLRISNWWQQLTFPSIPRHHDFACLWYWSILLWLRHVYYIHWIHMKLTLWVLLESPLRTTRHVFYFLFLFQFMSFAEIYFM
jgi:hypothetical protein